MEGEGPQAGGGGKGGNGVQVQKNPFSKLMVDGETCPWLSAKTFIFWPVFSTRNASIWQNNYNIGGVCAQKKKKKLEGRRGRKMSADLPRVSNRI